MKLAMVYSLKFAFLKLLNIYFIHDVILLNLVKVYFNLVKEWMLIYAWLLEVKEVRCQIKDTKLN